MFWDTSICGSHITLSNGNRTATKVTGGSTWNSAVLGVSACDHYSIKICKRVNGNIMVGLAPKSGFNIAGNNSCGYYLSARNGKIYGQNRMFSYAAEPITNGSTITVIYNKQAQEISFKIDNKDCGVVFNKVTGDLFPAVEFYDQNASVELL
jgi:hypothetical protein